MNHLPDFLIVGAMKSATSTLHEQLACQSGFFLSEPKEPCFFSDDEVWARGLDWYRSLFARARPGDLCGESSTHYTKLPTHPRAVERMRGVLSDRVRFVYLMRHPVDRLVSHYVHEWSTGAIDEPIDRAVAGRPELVHYGRYAYQLAPYLEVFGAARVLPVFVSRLEAQPQAELERVCRFLGYRGRPVWVPALGHRNVSRERMRPSAVRDALKDLPGCTWLRRTLLPRALRERIKDHWRMTERPRLSPATLAEVEAVFDQDLAELGEWIGQPLSCATFERVAAEIEPAFTARASAVWSRSA